VLLDEGLNLAAQRVSWLVGGGIKDVLRKQPTSNSLGMSPRLTRFCTSLGMSVSREACVLVSRSPQLRRSVVVLLLILLGQSRFVKCEIFSHQYIRTHHTTQTLEPSN